MCGELQLVQIILNFVKNVDNGDVLKMTRKLKISLMNNMWKNVHNDNLSDETINKLENITDKEFNKEYNRYKNWYNNRR